jgi:hypothetical protein
MQLTTFLTVAATVATTSAKGLGAVKLNSIADKAAPHARIINNCPYPVNLWSVVRGSIGCDDAEMVTLKKGGVYMENYQRPKIPGEGVSIKCSKTKNCKNDNIVQLEYFLEERDDKKDYWGNYLDVSYVDCTGNDCPTKAEGFVLDAGDEKFKALKVAADGSWCPTLKCSDAASCAKLAYILPDDPMTKTCDLDASMDFYMCGKDGSFNNGDDNEDDEPEYSAPAPSSTQVAEPVETPEPKPSTTLMPVVSSVEEFHIKAAAVTQAAKIEDAVPEPKVKTNTVYVTAYEYINAKKRDHAHAHARRHGHRA